MRNVFPAEYREKYLFSIVMAVYNTAPFLRETVESLLEQDIGFKDNVQLIMVDDGSTDGAGDIADEYALKYPHNIIVVHKSNGGVSSARNEGLKYVNGKYVNFLDSDDKLSKDALSKVALFFNEHEKEVDIVAIPIQCFDGASHEHGLNYKFKRGTRIIDLDKEYKMIQINIVASFVKRELATKIRYDYRLKYSEDVKICIKLLLENRKYGVVSDVRYWRRIRTCGEASAMQKTTFNRDWYFPVLEYFHKEIFSLCKRKYGRIPLFVQYAVLFDLKFKIKMNIDDIKRVFSSDEIEELRELISNILRDIDDEVVFNMNGLWGEDYSFILSRKYGVTPKLEACRNDVKTVVGGHEIVSVSNCKTCLEFLSVSDNQIALEGYVSFVGVEDENIDVYIQINNEELIKCKLVPERKIDTEYWGETILKCETFRGYINNIDNYYEMECKIFTYQKDIMVERKNLRVGKFFPLSRSLKSAYAVIGGWMVCIRENKICFSNYDAAEITAMEDGFINELESIKKYEAVRLRNMYHVLHNLKKREIWLIGDRSFRADDNGEALFRFLESNSVNEDVYFVLESDSPDYRRVSRYGKVVDYLSDEHKLLRLMADKIILSDLEYQMINPFGGDYEYYRDILNNQHLVFLQHGVTKDDISGWVNRYKQNISLFITCVQMEYNSIIDGEYFYLPKNVKITGFPRYDYLINNPKKKIIIMPTWRKYLEGNTVSNKDTMRHYDNSFIESRFFEFYNSLMNNERLLECVKANGYTLSFVPHPNLVNAIGFFTKNPQVEICPFGTRYCDMIASGDLLITDYSSIAFDFAYLKKPIIYAQFDKEEFYKGHTYAKGYFDYEKDGFGEVEYNLNDTIERVIEYIISGCAAKGIYINRINKFFKYNDRNNCQRVVEAIRML